MSFGAKRRTCFWYLPRGRFFTTFGMTVSAFSLREETATVNVNVRTCRVRRFGASEEANQVGNFIGSSFTTQCVGSLHTFAVFRRIETVVERSGNRAWTDSVATDSPSTEFLRHGTGKMSLPHLSRLHTWKLHCHRRRGQPMKRS